MKLYRPARRPRRRSYGSGTSALVNVHRSNHRWTESLEDRRLLTTQVITPSPAAISAAPGDTLSFDVVYSTLDAETSIPNGLSLRMYYNSLELTPDLDAIKTTIFSNSAFSAQVSDPASDNAVAGANQYVSFLWFNSGNQPFPDMTGNSALTLFTATFNTSTTTENNGNGTPSKRVFDGESVSFRSSLTFTTDTQRVQFLSTPAVLTANANANAQPVINSAATVTVAENQTSAYTVTATDEDTVDTLTYAISGGADAALFNIAPATGIVKFNTPPDFETPGSAAGTNTYSIQVTANDGTVNSAARSVAITVTDVDEPVGNTGTIQGRIFNDLDGDGTRDADEPWLNGWTIQLVNSTGTIVASQVTANRGSEAGWYKFDAAPGTYSLQEVLQTGWQQTAPIDGLAVQAFNLDIAQDFRTSANDFLNWGGRQERWIFGTSNWHFITPDGTLYQWDGSPRTNLTGTVAGVLSPAYYSNLSLLVDVEAASSPVYTITAGQTLPNVNFGNFNNSTPGSIHGRKWNDLNGDGQRSSNEPWLNGWTIELVNGPDSVEHTTVTMDIDLNNNGTTEPETESGWYWFNDVPVGDWVVREQTRPGWTQTSSASPAEIAAFDLDTRLNLRLTRSLFPNWGGLNERWILGDDAWYYITPNGDLFRWNGSPRTNLSGTRVAQLSSEYHTDPAKLYDARSPLEHEVRVDPGQKVEGVNFSNQQTTEAVPSDFAGAGNVSVRVSGKHLILTGDGAGNGVSVFTNAAGLVTVAGLGNTTIQGQTQPWVISGWTSVPGNLAGNLGGGNDALVLNNVQFGGTVTVNMHGGNDYLVARNIRTGQNFDYRSNTGNNTVVVVDSQIGNLARVITGGGRDAFHMENTTVGGRTVVTTGGGTDVFGVKDSTFTHDVSLHGGAQADWLAVTGNNTFGRNVAIDGGKGTDAIDVDPATVFIRTPAVRSFKQTAIQDVDAFLDEIMARLSNAGLDSL